MTARPTLEVGDRVQVHEGGSYAEVTHVFDDYHAGVEVLNACGLREPILRDMITDVYTKAEQEANGALVQIEDFFDSRFRLEEIDWDITNPLPTMDSFLTPEATAALGTFRPVPERDIVPGDVVRGENGVFIATQKPSAPAGVAYEYKGSLVAPEDPAYAKTKALHEKYHEDPAFIAPPVIKERGEHDHLGSCLTRRCKEIDPAPPVIKEPEPARDFEGQPLDPQPPYPWTEPEPTHSGMACTHQADIWDCQHCAHLGPRREPEPFASHRPECHSRSACVCFVPPKEPEPAPYRCDALDGFGSQCVVDHRPDPASSIPEAWDLITAGDGRNFELEVYNGHRLWHELNTDTRWYTDAEVLALGRVRRCVPVTLPDEWHSDYQEYVEDTGAVASKVHAAELLAAALHAEEGEHA